MSTKKISALTAGTTANGTDKIPIERSGANYYITPAYISTYINPMTTAGDIIKGGASGALGRLGIGSTGDVLTVAGGVPTWAAPASSGFSEKAQAKVTTPYSTTTATGVFLPFDVEAIDTASMIDLGTQPTRVTMPSDGEYDLNVWGYFAANATGVRIVAIYLGGVALIANCTNNAVGAGVHSFNIQINNVYLNATNYLQVQAYQNSGGNLNVTGCIFTVRRVA